MGDLLTGLITMVVGVGALALVLSGLYAAAGSVPERFKETTRAWVFLLPAAIAVTIGLVVPAVRTAYLSLLDDNSKEWVGLENYAEVFTNTGIRLTVFNTFLWVIVGTIIVVGVGLAVARFADGARAEGVIKSAIFLPGAISLVGAGVIWKFVYDGPPFDYGLLNRITGSIPGLPDSLGGSGDRLWLLERGVGAIDPPDWAPGFNTVLLIVIFVWVSSGLATVIFSAAIKGVPGELIEAAKMDGATDRQTFTRVVLPYIRATIVTVATLTTISALKVFDIVAATTGGRFDTSTVANEFYVTRFVQGRIGLGSALAVLIFVMVIPVVVINRRAQQQAEQMMGA